MPHLTIINYSGNWHNQFSELIITIGYNQKVHTFVKAMVVLLLIIVLLKKQKTTLEQIVFLFFCSLTVIVFRLPDALLPEQNLDESVYIGGARLLLENSKIWYSFDPYTSGPINLYSILMFHNLFGEIDYFILRLGGLFFFTIPSIFFLYTAICFAYDRVIASFVSFGYTVFLALLVEPDFVAYGAELPTLLIVSLQLLCLSAILFGRSFNYGYWLCFFAGLMPYTKLQGILIAVIIVLIFLFEIRNKLTLKRIALLVISGLIPSFILVIYLYTNSLFFDFYKSYIDFNIQYGGSFAKIDFALFVKMIFESTDITWFFLFILVVIVFSSCYLLIKGKKLYSKLFYCFILLVVVWYSIVKTGMPFQHYLVLSFFPLFWVFGIVSGELINLKPSFARIYIFSGSFIFILFILISFTKKNAGIAYAHFSIYQPDSIVTELQSLARKNDKMTIWGHGGTAKWYCQTSLLPGTRDIFTSRQINPSDLQPYFLQRFLSDLKRNKPRIIVEDNNYQDYQTKLVTIFSDLNKHYTLKATSGGYNIYLRNSE